MEYNAQPQEFPIDLSSFDLTDFVGNSGQELGNIFGGGQSASQLGPQQTQQEGRPQGNQQFASGGPSQPPPQQPQYNPPQSHHQTGGVPAQQMQQIMGMPQPTSQSQQSLAELGLAPAITPAILKERLEQHMRIQQLQQLQAQILQQQIEMLRASQDTPIPRREVAFQGLPTPAASSELLPTIQNDVLSMSPMVLQGMLINSSGVAPNTNESVMSNMQHLTMSAPPAMAFQQTSPAITDYELSPLTSPWLTGTPGVPSGQSPQIHPGLPAQQVKRTRRNSDADEPGARKRQISATARTVLPTTAASAAKRRTPPTRSTVARRSSLAIETLPSSSMDTQMLPPPPKEPGSSASSVSAVEPAIPEVVSPEIAPVTPGAIMGLTPMRPGLVPPTETGRPRRSAAKTRPAASPVEPTSASKRTGTTPLLLPTTPRNILPSGGVPIFPAAAHPPPVRKSTHKVAEQKRRDSMKLSYDELRLLLPPIPVNLDDADRDEPLMPGAMPPRGPPRGDQDGPNRAVSKLALLRSGNEYIRELQWKMERRDEEIATLRGEVLRMRDAFEQMGLKDEGAPSPPIDLTRHVDFGWDEVRRVRKAASRAALDEDDEEDD